MSKAQPNESKSRKYSVLSETLWHHSKRYSTDDEIFMTPSEAKWLLAQGKIKPVTAKRKRRAAPKREPKGEE